MRESLSRPRSAGYMSPYRLAQLLLVDLADARSREAVDEQDFLRNSVFRDDALVGEDLQMGLDVGVARRPFASDASLTTSAIGRSPHFSSFTPITAASATPAHCVIRSSICSDDTHSPPVLITSLMRSVIWT